MFKPKPWVTPAIQKSIISKNNLLKRLKNAKDSRTKETVHWQKKDYRNMLSHFSKRAKQISLPMVQPSQAKYKFQMPLRNILQQLLKKEKTISIPHTKIPLIF